MIQVLSTGPVDDAVEQPFRWRDWSVSALRCGHAAEMRRLRRSIATDSTRG